MVAALAIEDVGGSCGGHAGVPVRSLLIYESAMSTTTTKTQAMNNVAQYEIEGYVNLELNEQSNNSQDCLR